MSSSRHRRRPAARARRGLFRPRRDAPRPRPRVRSRPRGPAARLRGQRQDHDRGRDGALVPAHRRRRTAGAVHLVGAAPPARARPRHPGHGLRAGAGGVNWPALDDRQRREVALQILAKVPVLWIWDNVEPATGFPAGSDTRWSPAEQAELATFLRDARATRAKFLLTSRRDEEVWLKDLPTRIPVPPMPMQERVELARVEPEVAVLHTDADAAPPGVYHTDVAQELVRRDDSIRTLDPRPDLSAVFRCRRTAPPPSPASPTRACSTPPGRSSCIRSTAPAPPRHQARRRPADAALVACGRAPSRPDAVQ